MKLVATDTKVTIKWFVYAGSEKIRYTSSMCGTWGYDAECSCGWQSRTGGATKRCVLEEVQSHKTTEHGYKWAWKK